MAEPQSPAAREGLPPAEPVRAPRGSERLAAAMLDLSLDPVSRPSEQERALMLSLLTGLVGQIAEELLVRVPGPAANEVDPNAVVEVLRGAGLLGRADLVGLLLRRADVLASQAARPDRGPSLVQGWAADPVASVAAAAMAVRVARSSSRDRFGRPGLTLADCAAELAVALTYAVAASLPGALDPLAAAVDLLARHDEGERPEAQEARLVLALEQAGRLDGALFRALAAQGELGLLAEGLSRLARIPASEGWELLSGRGTAAVGRLLRLAELERALAAELLAALSDEPDAGSAVQAMAAFDAMTPDEVTAERTRLRLPLAFTHARAALERHGQRRA